MTNPKSAQIHSIHPQSRLQLPISWYCDPEIYQLEQTHIFSQAPNYIGHEAMIPNVGDYNASTGAGVGKALIRNQQGIELISNVCRHRQAIMLEGTGNTEHIICPLHRWTYDLQGELKGAPHFESNPCLHLNKTPLQQWNGLLFEEKNPLSKDFTASQFFKDFDFNGYLLNRTITEEYNFNWKTFIEVYLEDYHVGPFHPGLDHFVNCDDLKWEFGKRHSAQSVGVRNHLAKSGSKVYDNWHEQVLKYNQGGTPKHGAIWLVYYPFMMLEWYPNTLIVSYIIPRGVDQCTNIVEFYYPEDIALFEPDFVQAQQAAYNETAIEDKEICQRMHDGRKSLYQQGIDEFGPYQTPMEDGMVHFHDWMRQQIEPHL